MEPCLSAMWAKVTCGTFQQDSLTRSRDWDRMVVNLFWYSIKVRFPKTTSLAQDKSAVGGRRVESPYQYTFRMEAMAPTKQTSGGSVRVVDSHNFLASKNIASALVTVKPGGMRELHWHPNASEWQ